jgi:DNA end-binding protein Ku
MYYADEVRRPEEVPKPKVSATEVEMAKTLIENLAAAWDPKRYHDSYRSELLDLLERKAEGEPLPEAAEAEEGEVIDLMEALRESVAATKTRTKTKTKQKRSRRKAPARKAS